MNDLKLTISIPEIPTEFKNLIKDSVRSELQNFTPPAHKEEQLIKTKEACKLLHVSSVTLNQWRKEGRIPFHRIASRIYFKHSELLDSMESVKKYGRK